MTRKNAADRKTPEETPKEKDPPRTADTQLRTKTPLPPEAERELRTYYGRQLAKALEDQPRTQKAVEEEIGVCHSSTISRYKTGDILPKPLTIVNFCRVLGKNLEDFFGPFANSSADGEDPEPEVVYSPENETGTRRLIRDGTGYRLVELFRPEETDDQTHVIARDLYEDKWFILTRDQLDRRTLIPQHRTQKTPKKGTTS